MFQKTLAVLIVASTLFAVPYVASAAEAGASAVDVAALKAKYKRPSSIPFPSDNPYTEAKYDLGKMLFFDTRLSGSQIMSCATCHNPSFNWGDGLPKGVGSAHKELGRKTPSVLNLAWDELFFWDGRADSMEKQALGPISSEAEMNMPKLEDMLARLQGVQEYRERFAQAFPGEKDPINKENIAKAIATFERKIVSAKAPFDKWIEGDDKAISQEAKAGFQVFTGKAHCASCHSGWNFSDGSFHDIGLPSTDIGRGKLLPELAKMQHAFKTVGLRNIDQRGPYMHDGSLKTLDDVVEHYDSKFVQRPSLSDDIKPLNLTADEKKQLVSFLKTLTSKDDPVALPVLPR